jgi:NAD(P)-dependent dehydrogenase (short-subunit alcohol dehydrogenase family)
MELQGRAALVTGASRGLGAALSAELARRGARVVAVARGAEALERTVAGIRRAGGEAHAVAADQGEREAVYPLVGAATALVGPIDLLVLNASTLGPLPLRELVETECEDFARVLEVNLLGPFRLAKAVVGSMVVRGGGVVLGVSSDAAVRPPRLGRLRRLEGGARPHAADLGGGACGERRLLPEPRPG